MTDIITREVSSSDLKELVNKLIPDSMSVDITKACQGIYPLHDVHIRKVKTIRRPRFDLHKLMELHGETGKTTTTTDPSTGEVVTRAEGYEPPVLDAV
jgi:small subunit ribosomal protein S3Ae